MAISSKIQTITGFLFLIRNCFIRQAVWEVRELREMLRNWHGWTFQSLGNITGLMSEKGFKESDLKKNVEACLLQV